MKFSISGVFAWARQTTTGLGFATVVGAAASLLTHALSPADALPIIGTGLVLMAHPEMSKQQAAAAVQTFLPAATVTAKDIARQVAEKHVDSVSDINDVLAMATALDQVRKQIALSAQPAAPSVELVPAVPAAA